MPTFPKYESYQDSGVEWLGEIPSHWNIIQLKYCSQITTGTTPPRDNDSNFADIGIAWVKPDDLTGNEPIFRTKEYISSALLRKVRLIPKGSTLVCCIGNVGKFGFAGTDLTTNQQINSISFEKDLVLPKFGLYITAALKEEYEKLANGNVVSILNASSQSRIKIPVPSLDEQRRIVEFLDRATTDIDRAISQKQRLIELLQEQKAILINQAVTKGLNPNVPMWDSGIDWIGEIPEHWQVRRAKYLFQEVDERSTTGEEELLSVSHITGVTPRSEKNVNMFMAEDYSGSKLCHKDDLVINIMWAWMGALGVANQTGIVSPSYGVFRQIKPGTFNSWYLESLLRSIEYVAQYNRISTGLHSSRLRLYAHMFLSMEILFPPKHEQDQIEAITIDRIREIDAAIDAIDREIKTLEELRSVLISQAVTGKIKV